MNEENAEKHEKYPEFAEAREHFKAARNAMLKSWEAMMPPGYMENRRAARKEFLLGLRKLLDVAIEHTEKK